MWRHRNGHRGGFLRLADHLSAPHICRSRLCMPVAIWGQDFLDQNPNRGGQRSTIDGEDGSLIARHRLSPQSGERSCSVRSAEAPKSSTTRAGRQRAITAQGELGFTAAAADDGDHRLAPEPVRLHPKTLPCRGALECVIGECPLLRLARRITLHRLCCGPATTP